MRAGLVAKTGIGAVMALAARRIGDELYAPALQFTRALADLVEDSGRWVGTVHFLAKDVVTMTATYFPVRGEPDNIQLTGPILFGEAESCIAVVGGGGKFTGARGQARCVVGMSDQGSPLYRYQLTFNA